VLRVHRWSETRTIYLLDGHSLVYPTSTGAVLTALTEAHPELSITALVRRPESRKPVENLGPNVRTLEGAFDDLELIEQHAREADVVINTADSDTSP